MYTISDHIMLKKNYTANRLEYMNRQAKWQINKGIRAKASQAWKRGNTYNSHVNKGKQQCFYLYVCVSENTVIVPDCDSNFWLAKRCLDGAIDAGIIKDDTPDIIESVTVFAPFKAPIPAPFKVSLICVLANEEFLLGDDISNY